MSLREQDVLCVGGQPELQDTLLPQAPTNGQQSPTERSPQAANALVERVRAGETQLFYDLVSPYESRVYAAAIAVLQNPADAEDVMQEAFLKAFAHLASFRREARFGTWLIQITLNVARSKRRKDRRGLYESTDMDPQEGDCQPREFADWRETPVEALQRIELRRALRNAMATLDAAHREVFVLRDIEKLSIAETAEMLQISEALVKTRLFRARLRMREALAPGADGGWSVGDGAGRT